MQQDSHAPADADAPENTDNSSTPSDTLPPRRRRSATRPAGSPATTTGTDPEPPAAAVAERPAAAEPAEQPEPAPRARRRATRKATAPAGAPAASEAAAEAGEPESAGGPAAADVAEPVAEPAPRTRRRSRKATAPAGAPAAAETSEAGEPEQAGGPAAADVAEPAAERPARTRRRTSRKTAEPAQAVTEPTEQATEEQAQEPAGQPAAGRQPVFQPPVFQAPMFQTPLRAAEEAALAAEQDLDEPEDLDDEDVDEEDLAATQEDDAEAGERTGRRRRRGGRRRRRSELAQKAAAEGTSGDAGDRDDRGPDDRDEADAETEDDADESADEHGGQATDDDASSGGGSSRRRRRRRRRSGDSGDDNGNGSGDPERTVVKVREPRKKKSDEPLEGSDGVQSIRGSTRLEAKKQRRREGREQGRRRVPIITEAEFLARREAVERVMVVRQSGERTQIGVLEDDVLVEHYVNKEQSASYVGNVYLGKVQNVLPSMEAAFVDIGKGRNAVLYAGEVNFEALGMGGGPRRIEVALKSGQPVLVQVTKDPIGHKGARLTSQISLPGRYLVYVPEGSMTGISRKLPDTERSRLKQILKKIVPDDAGVIVRTAAEGATEDELTRDVERLQSQWQDIQKKAKKGNAPTLLYGEPDMTVRVVRDIFNEDFSKVIVSGDAAWSTIHDYVAHVAPDLAGRLQKWTSEVDVFATTRIDEQLMKALDRKVWLPSGGSLVIDRTEAMVVVDVNTGRFTGQGGNLEETVTRNNLEAAEEIVRQLRLRDLGGIIVIDFIDMVLESNRDLVLRRLLECLGRDRTKHQVAEVTSLGLVQMTRKRVGQGLLESFSEPCVHCNGRGVIVHMEQPASVGGSKKSRKKQRQAEAEAAEAVATAPAAAAPEAAGSEAVAAVSAEAAPAEPAGQLGLDDELYSSVAEAEEAVRRGRSRRRGRKATAPAGPPPEAGSVTEPAAETVAEPEPVTEVAAEVAAVPMAEPAPMTETEPEAPVRRRRRSVRKASAPAGAPAVPEVEPVVPEPERAPQAEAIVAAAEPAPERPRRRASRKAVAPAGSPSTAEAGVLVVEGVPAAAPAAPAAEPAAEPTAAPSARPRRAVRRASAPAGSPEAAPAEPEVLVIDTAEGRPAAKKAAKKATAKKADAKKATTKKATTKKATTKKAAAKKAAKKSTAKKSGSTTAAAEQSAPPSVSAPAGD